MLQVREGSPTPSPFVVFTFGLIVEFIKEFGGASWAIHLNVLICFGLLVLITNVYCHNNTIIFLKFNFLFFSNIYPIKLENSKKDLFSLSKNSVNDKTSKHD